MTPVDWLGVVRVQRGGTTVRKDQSSPAIWSKRRTTVRRVASIAIVSFMVVVMVDKACNGEIEEKREGVDVYP
jgi:hypothetical protein